MTSPAALRERAKRFRRMALVMTDQRAIEALGELADGYEAEAARLETAQKEQPAGKQEGPSQAGLGPDPDKPKRR